jgi:hypothetical protein
MAIDFTFTDAFFATGPTTINLNPDLANRVDRYENTVNSLSCTLTGDVPISGTATGTATCTGDVDFTIDIYNDGVDITIFNNQPLVGLPATLTVTNTGGTVTITGTVVIGTGAGVGVGDWDNSGPIGGPLDDAAGVQKTIDINIVGTLDTTVSPPEIVVTSGGLNLIPFSGDVININSAGDPPFDIEVPETGSVDLQGSPSPYPSTQ